MDTSTAGPMVGFDDNTVTVTWGREVYALNRDGQVSTQYQVPAHLVSLDEDVAVGLVLDKLANTALSAKARRDIADALGVDIDDVGQPQVRKAAA
jgi:hypothetical protein